MLSSTVWDWIIVRINIGVQPINGFASEVGSATRRNKSAPFGAVISCVAVIQTGVIVVVVATATNMVSFANAISAFLFYHLPRPQSRKSLPDRDDLGGLGLCIFLNFFIER